MQSRIKQLFLPGNFWNPTINFTMKKKKQTSSKHPSTLCPILMSVGFFKSPKLWDEQWKFWKRNYLLLYTLYLPQKDHLLFRQRFVTLLAATCQKFPSIASEKPTNHRQYVSIWFLKADSVRTLFSCETLTKVSWWQNSDGVKGFTIR